MVMAELKYHLSRESLLKEQQLIQITKQANISVYMLDFYIKQTHLSTHLNFFLYQKQKKKKILTFIQVLEINACKFIYQIPIKTISTPSVYNYYFFI
jgi:hypothetical protein